MTSNAVSKVTNFFFRKVLEIVDIIHQKSAAIYHFKPGNFWVNVKTLEVKLCSLRGVAKKLEADEGGLDYVSDLEIISEKGLSKNNTKKEKAAVNPEDKKIEVLGDGFLAPEFYYEN